jgi:hypothetical protein
MKIGRAIVAGIVGGIVVIVAMIVVGVVAGTDADLCALAGAVITGREDAAAWVIGCASQMVVAVIAALVYAAVFEWIVRRAGAVIGVAIALAHGVVAGIAVGFLPISGMVNAGMSPPGAFLEYRGWPVIVTFVLAHLAFGAIVGARYGETLHRVASGRATWHDVTTEPV